MPGTRDVSVRANTRFIKNISGGRTVYSDTPTYYIQSANSPGWVNIWVATTITINGISNATKYYQIAISGYADGPGTIILLNSAPTDYYYATNGTVLTTLSSGGHFDFVINTQSNISKALTYGLSFAPMSYAHESDITAINATITYSANSTPPEVVGLHPDNENVKGANPINCSWSFSHITGMVQTDWEIYTVRNAGTPVLRASGSGAATSGAIPANALDPGLCEWYVKVTAAEDSDTISGQSEPRNVIVRYDSSTSSVTCDGKPQPTVSWTSTWQAAFQMEFNGEKFKPIYSPATSYKLPLVYADGVYPVRLRILDGDGNWTEWTEPIYADIHNTPPTSGTLTLTTHIETGVASLNWALTGATAAFYTIHRNGVQIYAGNDTSYIDLRGCGKCEYTIRAMMSDSNCIAAKKTITVLPPSDLFILESEDGLIRRLLVRHHPSRPSRRIDIAPDTEFRHFAGRVFPIAVSEGHKTRGVSGTAMFKTAAEAERLMALAGKTLIYKDRNGNSVFGVMTGVGRDSALAETMSWRIEATDGTEVDYID